MKLFVKIILASLLLVFTAGLLFSFFLGHKQSLEFSISIFNQNHHSQKINALITPNKFLLLQTLVGSLIISIGLITFYFNKIYQYLNIYFIDFRTSIIQSIKNVFKFDGIYILIIPILSSIYFALILPVSYDEAWTYLNFTSQSLISSIAYYPAPNNHILHSLITNFTLYIPIFSPLVKMRIPSIFFSAFIWIISFSFFTKYFNKKFALVVIGITSMLFMNIYYSYMSRGYALLSLFFITALYFSFNIIKKNNESRNWIWFGVSSVLGFYVMPSFLYPFLTLNIFILFHNISGKKKQLFSNICIGAIVAILYSPIIAVNGLDAITNNNHIKPIPRTALIEKLITFFTNSISEILGISSIFILSLMILSLTILIFKRDYKKIQLYLIFIISPFILLSIHSVIPFSRTFVYYSMIIIILILLPVRNLMEKIALKYLFPAIIFVQGLLLFNFYIKIYDYEDYNITSNKVIKQISGNKKFLCNDELFDALLLFELKTNGFNSFEMKYYNKTEMNADTILNEDYIIISKSIDKTFKSSPKIETKYYSIY